MDKLPYEVETSSRKLLKKIYAAFPGSDAPDLLSDIEAFARKCMECAGHSGYDLDTALNIIASNLGTVKTHIEELVKNEGERPFTETIAIGMKAVSRIDTVLNFVERVREETKEVKGLVHHV